MSADPIINQLTITHRVSYRARLELLAEEAAELSQAALKLIRVLNNHNESYPVDKDKYTVDICKENLINEMADVETCASILELNLPIGCISDRLSKMVDRLKENDYEVLE